MKKILIVNLIGETDIKVITDAYPKLSQNSVVIDFIHGDREGIDDDYAGIIITGSPTHIYEKKENPWIIEIEKYMEKWLDRDVPVLGICFGIQLYADLEGREVMQNKIGRNMGRAQMVLENNVDRNHYIFKDINFESREIEVFCSHLYHVEPAPSVCGYLKTSGDQKIPMLEINGSFVGTQFHPEFSTCQGLEVLKNLVDRRRQLLNADSKHPNQIILDLTLAQEKCDNPLSFKFLTNFVDHCLR